MADSAQRREFIFGCPQNEDVFLESARRSIVTTFVVNRTDRDIEANQGLWSRLVVTTGKIGVGDQVGFQEPLVNHHGPLLLDIIRGWRTSIRSPRDDRGALIRRHLPHRVEINTHSDGVPIERPLLRGDEAGIANGINWLVCGDHFYNSYLSVAGLEPVLGVIDKLRQRGNGGPDICTELARLAEIGIALCNNPQIVQTTEE